jgi:hypothetical protein
MRSLARLHFPMLPSRRVPPDRASVIVKGAR